MQLRKPVAARQLISLTPLIDVVFILLVFFMLVSNFHVMRAIEIDTPGGTVTTTSMEGAVLVRLLADGTLDLNGVAINPATLVGRVETRLNRDPGQRFLVQAEPGVPFQRVVTMFDRLAEGEPPTSASRVAGGVPDEIAQTRAPVRGRKRSSADQRGVSAPHFLPPRGPYDATRNHRGRATGISE